MNFKFKPEKSNLNLMISTIIILIFTCIGWLLLKEYLYFILFTMLAFIIIHVYFFQSYYLDKDFLIIRIGFLKIKIKYSKINSMNNENDILKINLKNLNIDVYPDNKDKFIKELKKKIK